MSTTNVQATADPVEAEIGKRRGLAAGAALYTMVVSWPAAAGITAWMVRNHVPGWFVPLLFAVVVTSCYVVIRDGIFWFLTRNIPQDPA